MRRALLAACALLSGCRTPQAGEEVPALIVNPTAASRAALASAVGAALGGAVVMLSDDALTAQSWLAIDRRPRRDPEGTPAQGRELGRPEEFLLVKSGGRCVLVHQRTGQRYPLADTECVER